MGIGIAELVVMLTLITVGSAGTIFWVWALIDCATNEPREYRYKVFWVVIILFTHLLGSLAYVLIRRPERVREVGK